MCLICYISAHFACLYFPLLRTLGPITLIPETTPTSKPSHPPQGRPTVPTDVCSINGGIEENLCLCGRCVETCESQSTNTSSGSRSGRNSSRSRGSRSRSSPAILGRCNYFCQNVLSDDGDIQPPEVLYLKPLDNCNRVRVQFQRESSNCFDEFSLSGTVGTFAEGTFAVHKPDRNRGVNDCTGNKKLNPRIYVTCTGVSSGSLDTTRADIHASCSEDLYIGQMFSSFQIAGYCMDAEISTDSCGFVDL